MSDLNLDQLRLEVPPGIGALKLPVVCRRQHDQDVPFIFDGWLKTYRSAKSVSQIPSETFYYWHHRLIEGLWFDRTAAWVVACNPEHPTQVYGFIVGQRADTLAGDSMVLHYCYVAKNYRRFGLAARLLATLDTRPDSTVIVTTHQTDASKSWLKDMGKTVLFNSYLFVGRAPVPHPELKGYDGKRARRRQDPVISSRRTTTVGGFIPGPHEG